MQHTQSKLEEPQPLEPSQTNPSQEPVVLKPKISPQLTKKYRQIFDSYDKEQDGYVQAKDVPGVLKILGVSITEQEVVQSLGERAIKSDTPLISSKIDFADFLALIVDKEHEMAMKEQLMESFRVFDTERNGFIPVSQMRYYLRTYGVAMSQEEVEQLIKDSQPEEGYVKYEKFVNNMLDIS